MHKTMNAQEAQEKIKSVYDAQIAIGASKAKAWAEAERFASASTDYSVLDVSEYTEYLEDLRAEMMKFPFQISKVDEEEDFPTLEGVVDHMIVDWGWESGKPRLLIDDISYLSGYLRDDW